MSLTNLSFIGVYFPLMLVVYYNPLIKGNTFRKILLVGASLGLYAFADPTHILLLMGVILADYLLVKLSDRTGAEFFRIFAIAADALLLLTFKYINALLPHFFPESAVSSIAFPVGLSYFTFKAISYVVDSRKEKEGSLLDAAIYIANFLTITAGPLSTYADELPSIREKHAVSGDDIYRGLERMVVGLGKKVIIADSLNTLVVQCFASSSLSVLMAWAGAAAYTLQLYFDFSGYTDMAIGIGTLFGFRLPENFNIPYMAVSVTDFWKRWHISLTKWFTKYIYFPMGGSRVKTTARHIFNLFVVWLVTGMWHGSTATFILWAMIYFVLQVIEKYTKWADLLGRLHLGHVYTLTVVMIEWVIFRSSSVSSAFYYIRSMFCLSGNSGVNAGDLTLISRYAVPLILGLVFSTGIGAKLKSRTEGNTVLNALYDFGLLAVFAVCVLITISQGYSAPLYAGF